jgi:hypothetical protein
MSWWQKALGYVVGNVNFYNYPAGEVLTEGLEIQGIYGSSFVQWRTKKTSDGKQKFISLRLHPSFYYGPEGNANYFVDFDLESARAVRESLDEIIAELETGHRKPAS